MTHRPELTRSLGTEGGWDVPCGTPQLSEPGLWAHPSCLALAWPGRARLGACLRPAPSVSRWQPVTRTKESMLIRRALAVGPSLSPARGDGRRGPGVLGDDPVCPGARSLWAWAGQPLCQKPLPALDSSWGLWPQVSEGQFRVRWRGGGQLTPSPQGPQNHCTQLPRWDAPSHGQPPIRAGPCQWGR